MKSYNYKLISFKSCCKIFAFLLVSLYACQALAQNESATAISSFLRMDVDARGAAMGGAHGALTEDVYSVYWNPAGLSSILLKELGFTYQNTFQDLNYGFVGYATPAKYFGVVAGQLFFLSSGSVLSTTEKGDTFQLGTSSSVIDIGIGLSQSRKIIGDLSYGLSLKLLYHKLMDESAFSFAFDAGVIYRDIIEGLDIGMALQNVSTSYNFINQELYEPKIIRLASLYSLLEDQLLLAGDYNLCVGNTDTLNTGIEYWVLDLIALRAGIRLPALSEFLSVFSFGFGINWRDTYRFDYSLSPHSELGANHRFSVIVKF